VPPAGARSPPTPRPNSSRSGGAVTALGFPAVVSGFIDPWSTVLHVSRCRVSADSRPARQRVHADAQLVAPRPYGSVSTIRWPQMTRSPASDVEEMSMVRLRAAQRLVPTTLGNGAASARCTASEESAVRLAPVESPCHTIELVHEQNKRASPFVRLVLTLFSSGCEVQRGAAAVRLAARARVDARDSTPATTRHPGDPFRRSITRRSRMSTASAPAESRRRASALASPATRRTAGHRWTSRCRPATRRNPPPRGSTPAYSDSALLLEERRPLTPNSPRIAAHDLLHRDSSAERRDVPERGRPRSQRHLVRRHRDSSPSPTGSAPGP